MYNLKVNEHQRKSARQAMKSRVAAHSAPSSLSASFKDQFGPIIAKQMDAVGFQKHTCRDLQRSIQKLGDSVVALPLQQQLQATADIHAMLDVYKEVFNEVKAKYGYHGTFEQYIEDVSAAVESADPDTPVQQIGKLVLTHQIRR